MAPIEALDFAAAKTREGANRDVWDKVVLGRVEEQRPRFLDGVDARHFRGQRRHLETQTEILQGLFIRATVLEEIRDQILVILERAGTQLTQLCLPIEPVLEFILL